MQINCQEQVQPELIWESCRLQTIKSIFNEQTSILGHA